MKPLFKIFILLFVIALIADQAFAQGKGKAKDKSKTEVKQKGKGPPPWAPAHGYRKRHIYFPAYKCYYDNTKGVYFHMDKDKWVVSAKIPLPLIGVDLKVAKKVELELDDNMNEPHKFFEEHKKKYASDK